ncbi:MAG: pyruvate dehydrogenase (acetyl-transferring) E1 component subunit alpha [Alphaproteobacteria bacterium]
MERGAGVGEPSAEELIRLYRDMLLIRRFEEKAGQVYGTGLIGGFCHLYIGQEAVVVGLQACAAPGDSMVTSYRDHGHLLACGVDPKAVMAELMGRRTGCSAGKGGSMHMFDVAAGFFGGHGIVGAQVPVGTGLAFAHRYRGDGGLCLCCLGDGAINQGQVSEAFNMAALWSLPVLYAIENNRYGMGTSVERAMAGRAMSERGFAYGIPGREVDGMDVLAVRAAVAEAVAEIRAGGGPRILDMKTYRFRGHSMSDPASYRSREEVALMRSENDPIARLRARMLGEGAIDEAGLKEIDGALKAVVAEAIAFAEASPEPVPAELLTDVLAEGRG